jgi:hypothetical protein
MSKRKQKGAEILKTFEKYAVIGVQDGGYFFEAEGLSDVELLGALRKVELSLLVKAISQTIVSGSKTRRTKV